MERAHAKVTGRIERLTDMMADGIGNDAEMKSRLAATPAEHEGINRGLEDVEVTVDRTSPRPSGVTLPSWRRCHTRQSCRLARRAWRYPTLTN